MKKRNNAGFTLVELMVVAIIVAILASVAIPMMSGNKNKAIATEAYAGLGTLRVAFQIYKAENGTWPTFLNNSQFSTTVTNLIVKYGDLAGKYFKDDGYKFLSVTTTNYTLQATGYSGESSNLVITLTDAGVFSGL